jgi:hypothetical protein
VNAGTSACSFVVNVADTTQNYLRNGYWPLTTGSWWKSVPVVTVSNPHTVTRTVVGAETVSGKIYTKHSIEIVQSNGSKTSTINYIRKDSSGSYFTYVDTTTWGVAAQLRNIGVHFLQSKLDVIFLKDCTAHK